MRNIEKYRAPVFIVERLMMKPNITPHHQPVMWKNRSPVLSGKF
jgi:hypothetical protein